LPRVARILIIDDDPAVSVTLARMLGLDGHTVIRVETAHDGLARSQDDPPDAIILDMRMPAMGGLEFLRRLRADDRLQHLPVGIITGDYFLGDDILAELSALGASVRYKPVWMDDLSALTRSLLARRDSRTPVEPAS
jgi:DNA-binding response OmpR family regulator